VDWYDRIETFADGAVTVVSVLLLAAICAGFITLGVLAWISGGPLVRLLALAPVLVLCTVCLSELRGCYRTL
jgi:hypothetical protein